MILSPEQLSKLKKYDSPTICNAIEAFGIQGRLEGFMMPGMILRTDSMEPTIGYAVTAKVSGSMPDPRGHQMLMGYYQHVRDSQKPCIAVIQDVDKDPCGSFWGEVQATVHKSLGGIGAVVDGGVRDITEANNLGFSFYSTQVHVAHGYTHVEKYGCPVKILGLEIHPGDLLFADQYGVVKIPGEVAPHLAEACEQVIKAELPMLEPCREAIRKKRMPTVEELDIWRSSMDRERVESGKLW